MIIAILTGLGWTLIGYSTPEIILALRNKGVVIPLSINITLGIGFGLIAFTRLYPC